MSECVCGIMDLYVGVYEYEYEYEYMYVAENRAES